MTISYDTAIDSPFAEDVLHGLSQQPKTLPCKWFYDERGSQLFEDITKTREYYPTRVETRLLAQVVSDVAQRLPQLQTVIEPGSGASVKTRLLLRGLPRLQQYIPLDISEDFLLQAGRQLSDEFPQLTVSPIVADFSQAMPPLNLDQHAQRLVFFPGSTIGNFAPAEACTLLRNMHVWAGKSAWLLIGVDMTQDASTLLAAYNDAAGITAQFNKNILVRANRELDADFDIAQFHHRAIYNRSEHRMEMHLVSRIAQQVSILGQHFRFAQNESIHTENCYKYPAAEFAKMAHACDWQIEQSWQDQIESAFTVFLLKSHNPA